MENRWSIPNPGIAFWPFSFPRNPTLSMAKIGDFGLPDGEYPYCIAAKNELI
jgi:hypothetical protein